LKKYFLSIVLVAGLLATFTAAASAMSIAHPQKKVQPRYHHNHHQWRQPQYRPQVHQHHWNHRHMRPQVRRHVHPQVQQRYVHRNFHMQQRMRSFAHRNLQGPSVIYQNSPQEYVIGSNNYDFNAYRRQQRFVAGYSQQKTQVEVYTTCRRPDEAPAWAVPVYRSGVPCEKWFWGEHPKADVWPVIAQFCAKDGRCIKNTNQDEDD
jgi:hypothetical protein